MKTKIAGTRVAMFLWACAALLSGAPARACTIFVLTDTNRALFCNNEDWSNPKTRIWFLPGGDGHYGAVYVGFDDGWAQGGMNTKGLAYDWVAGYDEKWAPDPTLPDPGGNSSQRMLETCATVDDAISFYRRYREAGFWRAKILVADRSGASVIIGAKDGKLQVESENQCRGFGFGWRTLAAALKKHPEPSEANGFKILRDCRQPGQYATRYSNIYDLKSGDIYLYPAPESDDEVTFNLAAELKKGGHYYNMPAIHEEMSRSLQPLLSNMQRRHLDAFKPIPDKEPTVTSHIRAMVKDAAEGNSHAEDYTADAWKDVLSQQKEIQVMLKFMGDLNSMTLVDRGDENGQRSYRYRLDFANATLLFHLVLDDQDRFASGNMEDELIKNPFSPAKQTK
jgi:hypothetical protein